jgi:UMP-CMP kinase
MAPTFDNNKIIVIYVLGGPGAGKVQLSLLNVWLITSAGKGTQCGRLVEDFGFCHLSGELSSRDSFQDLIISRQI